MHMFTDDRSDSQNKYTEVHRHFENNTFPNVRFS